MNMHLSSHLRAWPVGVTGLFLFLISVRAQEGRNILVLVYDWIIRGLEESRLMPMFHVKQLLHLGSNAADDAEPHSLHMSLPADA